MLKVPAERKQLILAWILLAAAFICLICFINVKVDCLLDSDMSSELILGRLLSSENGILTQNWYYSTELRVLNTQLLYAFFFHFTDDWHTVRVLSSVCLYVIYLFAYYVLCRALACRRVFAATAVLLLLPFSVLYADIVLIGVYYIPHIAITFVSVALAEFWIRTQGRKAAACLAGLYILAFLSGLGGVRQIVVLYFPLLLAVLAAVLLRHRELFDAPKAGIAAIWGDADSRKSLTAAAGTFVCAGAGYVVNTRILSGIYLFKSWNGISFTGLDFGRAADALNGLLSSFGYTEGKVFGTALISNSVCLAWIVMTIVSLRHIIRNRKTVPAYAFRMALFTLSAFTVLFSLYLVTDMTYTDWHNLPVAVLSIPCIALYLKDRKSAAAGTAFLVLVLIGSIINCADYIAQDNTAELRTITGMLTEECYDEGYATFWYANVLTELSNGSIDVRDLVGDGRDGDAKALNSVQNINSTVKWLQLTEHDTTRPDGKVFLLFTADEVVNNNWFHDTEDVHCIYSSENYAVFGFDSYDDLLMAISSYTFSFDNNLCLLDGADIDGHREIYPGGVSYGPYRAIAAGDYIVTITGENLDEAEYSLTLDCGTNSADISFIQSSDKVVQYRFTADDILNNAETVVRNNGTDTVILYTMTIEREK